ncbi:MAG: UvrD-helicase domain-containing protein [Candidatus Omnitrophica bacterium]|nr:UvrD-helicase domain-containing protein [Candidatus Omnitrophota bacterium]
MKFSHEEMFLSPEIRVVEASAGSGKTYALARRYVQLILHLTRQRQIPPVHSILAITFTNKAAFEMKERILKFLKQLALGVMPEDESAALLAPIGMRAEEAKELAGKIMQTILRHYNYFQVETIDKFINALLVSSAFQVGLTANFRIKTNSREYLARALDVVIERVRKDPVLARAFDDFLISMLLVESRSSWLPKDVVLDTVEKLFNEYNTYGLDFTRAGITPQDLIQSKAAVIADMKVFASPLPEGLQDRFAQGIDAFLEEYHAAFSFKGLPKSFQPDNEKRMKKGASLSPEYEKLWGRVEEGFKRAAALEVAHLYDPYIELFEQVRAVFDTACVREDVVFLSQLNAKARAVYAQGMGVDELYYRLAARYEHYLLDEFQDTSLLQWENLRVLPEEAIAQGGSLFYVGDKKQAIYGFRGGDTRLFDAVAARYAAPDYHCRKDTLDKSYRSRQAIVDFNNRVFSLENLERLMMAVNDKGERLIPARGCDKDELRRVYSQSKQEAVLTGAKGYVRLEVLAGVKKDDYREDARIRVLARLDELKDRFKWSDIVILVRKNNDVEDMTRWLLEAGVPATSDRTLSIKKHPLVEEIVAFLRFLLSPSDNASFGSFISGDIFCSAAGIKSSDIQDLIMSWRRQRGASLSLVFADKYPQVWKELVEPFLVRCGLHPLYELLVMFFRQTKALEIFVPAQGFLMRFLGVVKAREDEFPGVAEFLACYETIEGDELFVEVLSGAKEGDAVRVMTVHKAKGLEFPVVIIPFLTMGLGSSSSGGNKALAYTLRVEDEALKLYHFTAAHLPYSDCAQELDVEEDMQTFFSELNNLYVALTRAACEMYGFLPLKAGNAHNLAVVLFPAETYAVGAPAQGYPGKAADLEGTVKKLMPPVCRDWMGLLEDEFVPVDQPSTRSLKDSGNALHALLAEIKVVVPGQERSAVSDALAQNGRLKELVDEEALVQALAEPCIRTFFRSGAGEVHCEYALVDRMGNTHRLDRLIITPDEVIIVDFKSSRGDPAGRSLQDEAQVRTYMELLKQIYPGRSVKGYLVFINEKEVKEVGADLVSTC